MVYMIEVYTETHPKCQYVQFVYTGKWGSRNPQNLIETFG